MGMQTISGIGEVTLETYNQFIYLNSNGSLSKETITCPNFIWKKIYL